MKCRSNNIGHKHVLFSSPTQTISQNVMLTQQPFQHPFHCVIGYTPSSHLSEEVIIGRLVQLGYFMSTYTSNMTLHHFDTSRVRLLAKCGFFFNVFKNVDLRLTICGFLWTFQSRFFSSGIFTKNARGKSVCREAGGGHLSHRVCVTREAKYNNPFLHKHLHKAPSPPSW